MECFILSNELLEKWIKENLFVPKDVKIKRIFVNHDPLIDGEPELGIVMDHESFIQTERGYRIPINYLFYDYSYDIEYFYEQCHL